MRDFEKFFQHIKSLGYSPDICIDVGAGYGTGSIYSAFPEAHHIVFEPIKTNLDKLNKRLAKLSHEIHICALMHEPGEMTLTLSGVDNLGSSLMNRNNKSDGETVSVPVYCLDKFIESIPSGSKVLLKTDCQGADLNVLKGASNVLKTTDVVIVEASLFPFWGEHHPTLHELSSYMKEQGFEIYDLLEHEYRPLDNALGQVDVVFTKNDGIFRESKAWGQVSNQNKSETSKPVPSEEYSTLINQKNAEISHLKALISKSKNKDKLISHMRNLFDSGAKQESIVSELQRCLNELS